MALQLEITDAEQEPFLCLLSIMLGTAADWLGHQMPSGVRQLHPECMAMLNGHLAERLLLLLSSLPTGPRAAQTLPGAPASQR